MKKPSTECRLQLASFRSLMYLLTEHMLPRTHGYSFEFAVIVTLYWIAAGMSYRVLGNSFDLCHSTAFDLTAMVLDIICRVLHQVIRLPTAEELPQIGQQFCKYGFFSCFCPVLWCHRWLSNLFHL
ncbi:uncharacterized protein LOC127751848 [Frankliniella occidentalis]|uniref:Uncharacterized protein LOC127751848 n=1 Tax=Frankliniella occidentalis TaxID=133901 RepID=A0A9C6XVB6_FRAOC|nr:uncharacterized protein LOC127751848 [Frankliniella occidentalis]